MRKENHQRLHLGIFDPTQYSDPSEVEGNNQESVVANISVALYPQKEILPAIPTSSKMNLSR